MTKLKILFWLLLVALLVTFALENALPGPQLKFLRLELGHPPVSLVMYGAFIVGFLSGWLAHVLKVRKKKRAASAQEKSEYPEAPHQEQNQ